MSDGSIVIICGTVVALGFIAAMAFIVWVAYKSDKEAME